jgi:anti-sigma B factor antagonist
MSVPFETAIGGTDPERVVTVRGTLDVVTVPYLARVLEDLASTGVARLRLDLSGVTFIDSRGVAAVIAAWRSWSRDDGSIEIVRSAPAVMRVFATLGMEDALPFVDPVEG